MGFGPIHGFGPGTYFLYKQGRGIAIIVCKIKLQKKKFSKNFQIVKMELSVHLKNQNVVNRLLYTIFSLLSSSLLF